MTIPSIAPGLLLGAACVALATLYARRAGGLTLLAWAILGIGGIYGAGSMLVALGAPIGPNPEWDRYYLMADAAALEYHAFLTLVVLGGMAAGWWLVGKVAGPWAKAPAMDSIDRTSFLVCAHLLLATALACQLLYSYAYGGPLGLLRYSMHIRAGDFMVYNPFSFLQPFAGFAMFSAFIFAGLLLSCKRDLHAAIGFGLSFLVSLYVLYSWLGRLSFLIFVVTFPLVAAFRVVKSPTRRIAFLLTSFAAILGAAYIISNALRIHPENGLLAFVAKELCYPFVSYFAHLAHEAVPYRWFYDYAATPFFLLPEKLTIGRVESINLINTALIHDGYVAGADVIVGHHRLNGSVPIDLVTLGLIQVPIVGLPLTGMIFGGLLRLVETAVMRLPHAGIRSVLDVHLGFRLGVLGICGAAPNLLVRNSFYLLAGGVLLTLLLGCDWRRMPAVGRWAR